MNAINGHAPTGEGPASGEGGYPLRVATMRAPAFDLAMAARFLDALAPGETVTFQTFDDVKRDGKADRKLRRILHGTLEQHAAALKDLGRRGAGAFVMVNRGDGRGRTARNVTAVRALFWDLDGAPLAPLLEAAKRAGLEPHIVVESSPGRWHAYLLVESCPLAQFGPLQVALAERFGGDPVVKDLCRVMRLPGTLHRKGEPTLCRLDRVREGRAFTVQEIVEGFSLVLDAPRERAAERSAPPQLPSSELPAFRSALDALALASIDGRWNLTRDAWLHMLYAIHAAYGGSNEGRQVALEWSESAAGWDDKSEGLLNGIWDGSDATHPDGIGPGSVFHLARERAGWVNPGAALTADDFDDVSGGEGPKAAPFEVVNLDGLGVTAPPPQRWYWDRIIPAGAVTLLAAHGGVGKSTLALMLAATAADARQTSSFLGVPLHPCRVCYYSAEDPREVVMRRLDAIVRGLELSPDRVRERLTVLDATGGDPILFADQPGRGVRAAGTTATYQALDAYVARKRIELLVIDNASDAFAASEIDRPSVRAFVRSLAQLVKARDGAVLLLSHVDKATAKASGGPLAALSAGEAYSGSSAWNNSARSRLFMHRRESGLLELKQQKSNLGPLVAPIVLEWPEGELPRLVPAPDSLEGGDDVLLALLTLVHDFEERGEHVSATTSGPSTAARQFKDEPGCPKGLKPAQITAKLRDAEREGLLRRENFLTAGRRERERFVLSESGRARVLEAGGAVAQSRDAKSVDGGISGELVRSLNAPPLRTLTPHTPRVTAHAVLGISAQPAQLRSVDDCAGTAQDCASPQKVVRRRVVWGARASAEAEG